MEQKIHRCEVEEGLHWQERTSLDHRIEGGERIVEVLVALEVVPPACVTPVSDGGIPRRNISSYL